MIKTRSWRRKNYLLRKAFREAKKRKRSKILNEKKRHLINQKILDKSGYYQIKPPENFSLINNPEEILRYFARARSHFKRGYKISFGLENIKNLTPDVIAVMTAMLQDLNFTKGMRLKGNAPHDPVLSDMFVKSGFYQFVNSKLSPKTFEEGKVLRYKSNKKVDRNMAVQICKEAIKHTFKEQRRYPPIYEILIECMDNTHDHADPNSESVYNWWLFLYKAPDGKSYFSFIDLGVGVFESLSIKDNFSKFKEFLKIENNIQLVEKLINGEIPSRTGSSDRGKGWPSIYQKATQSDRIKNLTLVSNNVYANLSTKDYKQLKASFRGTFIYWELHPIV